MKGLSRKSRRDLGINFRQVVKTTRSLAKAGTIKAGMPAKEAALLVAAEMSSKDEYAEAWEKVFDGEFGFDWDAFLAFVLAILEVIMPFIIGI